MQKVFPNLCQTILFNSRLFLIGAAFFNCEPIPKYQSGYPVQDSVWEVEIAEAKLAPKSPMLCKKFASALSHDSTYIFAIGGDYAGDNLATNDA